jgi:hypothetical protein
LNITFQDVIHYRSHFRTQVPSCGRRVPPPGSFHPHLIQCTILLDEVHDAAFHPSIYLYRSLWPILRLSLSNCNDLWLLCIVRCRSGQKITYSITDMRTFAERCSTCQSPKNRPFNKDPSVRISVNRMASWKKPAGEYIIIRISHCAIPIEIARNNFILVYPMFSQSL